MTQILREGRRVVVKPQQNIVAPATDDLRREIRDLVSEGLEELAIDLTGVEMIDSTGLGLFISAHNSMKKAGGKMLVTNATMDIHALFKSMRLDQHFTVSGT